MACNLSRRSTKCHGRNPKDLSYTKDRIKYYVDMAKLAEKGKITSIFFTDSYGNPETYEKSASAIFLGGGHIAHMDPLFFAVPMAMATSSVGITCTGTTSYIGMLWMRYTMSNI
jgi:alkanesulfonate monooxygenase SsuD/methylene tetrahydromethanopterin reductase-like flavin-dependent oxidoreductase (luciferase family)